MSSFKEVGALYIEPWGPFSLFIFNVGLLQDTFFKPPRGLDEFHM